MLEGRGISCRLAPLGSSVYPQMGFAVHVPVGRIEEARELIESETRDEAEAIAERELELPTPEPDAVAELRAMDLARRAVRFAREHPTILLTAVPSFAMTLAFDAISDPDAGVLQTLRTLVGPMLLVATVNIVIYGLGIAFVDSALEERPSWGEAVRRMTPALGTLLGFEIVLGAPFFVPVWFGWLPDEYPPALTALLVAAGVTYGYVLFRLFFVPMALIIDRTGASEACRRSWGLVGRSWITIVGLGLLAMIVSLPFELAKPVERVVNALVGAVQTVAFVLAYRMLTGRPTAFSSTR
jgi:hypothetical protein